MNSCYRHFEDLITIGLRDPPPSSRHHHPRQQQQHQPLKIKFQNLSADDCSAWAWATIQGNIPADYHNAYNYGWYAYRMLYDIRSNNSDIYAIRMEHLHHDWSVVDQMLGGDGIVPSALHQRQNAAQIKPLLRVRNPHAFSEEGRRNLCRALCEEIQVYKQLLVRAIDLSEEDVTTSLEELQQQCPEETSIKPRSCSY